jgi:hypothetical protein
VIGRRDFGAAALAGSFAFLAEPAVAQHTKEDRSNRESILLGLASAFYRSVNRGHWGTLSDLTTNDLQMRTNSGYPSYKHFGGQFFEKDKAISFLQDRHAENKWYWDFEASRMFVPQGDYVCSFAEPMMLDDDCKGVLCAFTQSFVHVFWCKLTEVDGVVVDSKIADVVEVQLRQVGLQ